ncbi:hypothetical protein [Streptomyces sp. NPDC008092]|uniref:hypothetical protein n=1 Tax=Streptomyces sp. NPDC008092 TaxID=3364808 RepID=UPI0036EC2CF0
MATDTAPAVPPGPPDPPQTPATTSATGQTPSKGFLASMVAAVEPARAATFNIAPTTGAGTSTTDPEGILDRSAPGVSSASYQNAEESTAKDPDGRQRKAQGSIWKAWWLAGAQRWGKGGGTANKRLDLRKAQAQSHQVKESRTTSLNRSGGIPVRNSSGSGGGFKNNTSKSGGNSNGKGQVNSAGNRAHGPGRDGSGGRSGSHGPAGSGGGSQPGGGRKDTGAKDPSRSGNGGKGAPGSPGSAGAGGTSGKDTSNGSKTPAPKHSTDKTPNKPSNTGSSGGPGKQGSSGTNGTAGKDGKPGAAGTSGGVGSSGKGGHSTADTRTPLEKSRTIGHQDGSTVRNVVDHVKAYKDGVVDGYRDKKDENAKEHDRLDDAHDKHKTAKAEQNTKPDKDATGGPLTAVVNGQHITITDDNTPLEDPLMAKPTPIQAQGIDATHITLGDGFLKNNVSRGELRRFKQYEGRLEARIDGLARVADATKALAAQARDQATECQNLAEQAKSVEGGEKLVGTLTKLADHAKAQAEEADEVNRKAIKAHDFAKAVLSNIQTRYTPLYQAVVDSDETKPAELKFYADRGVTPAETALAA